MAGKSFYFVIQSWMLEENSSSYSHIGGGLKRQDGQNKKLILYF